MTTPPSRSLIPEWQLWAYQVKAELQGTIHAVDTVLKEFQKKITTVNDDLHSIVNNDLSLKISEINDRLLDFAQLKENFESSRTSLTKQQRQIESLQEDLATEQGVSATRHKQQVGVNKNTREDMQRAAEHLANLQKQATLDSERKDSEMARLETDNEVIWQKIKEMEATLMQASAVEHSEHFDPSGRSLYCKALCWAESC